MTLYFLTYCNIADYYWYINRKYWFCLFRERKRTQTDTITRIQHLEWSFLLHDNFHGFRLGARAGAELFKLSSSWRNTWHVRWWSDTWMEGRHVCDAWVFVKFGNNHTWYHVSKSWVRKSSLKKYLYILLYLMSFRFEHPWQSINFLTNLQLLKACLNDLASQQVISYKR